MCVLIDYIYSVGWLGSFVSDGNFHRFSTGFPVGFPGVQCNVSSLLSGCLGKVPCGLRGFVVGFLLMIPL